MTLKISVPIATNAPLITITANEVSAVGINAVKEEDTPVGTVSGILMTILRFTQNA